MKIKNILKLLLLIIVLSIITIYDIADRSKFYSTASSLDELTTFSIQETSQQQQIAYIKNFGNKKYSFPREKVSKVKLFKNTLLISRLTCKTLNKQNEELIISLLNNPSNFSWEETTWNTNEAEYILRFYNNEELEIGKIWLCIKECGMTKAYPFSPNMKYGALSSIGKFRLEQILTSIEKQ